LANLAGFGGIVPKIKDIIKQLRQPINASAATIKRGKFA
jgi:hypothetical protein